MNKEEKLAFDNIMRIFAKCIITQSNNYDENVKETIGLLLDFLYEIEKKDS